MCIFAFHRTFSAFNKFTIFFLVALAEIAQHFDIRLDRNRTYVYSQRILTDLLVTALNRMEKTTLTFRASLIGKINGKACENLLFCHFACHHTVTRIAWLWIGLFDWAWLEISSACNRIERGFFSFGLQFHANWFDCVELTRFFSVLSISWTMAWCSSHCNLPAVYIGLIVVTMSPASIEPSVAIGNSGMFGKHTAITSPICKFNLVCKRMASAAEWSRNWE